MRLSTRLLLRLGPVVLGAIAALGCGGEHDATSKQLDELHGEIARLRASQAALGERLDAIDIERGTFARGASAPSPAATAPALAIAPPPAHAADRDRPVLDVVHLSPSEGDGDADTDPSRPMIRASGDGASPRQTLSNKSIGARSTTRKGVVPSAPKKPADADARPVTKP